MTEPAALGVDDALETLVRQFSDPLACLRELVQNSLDAGSRAVDVTMDHADGVMTLEVQDHGEGMDRHVIDTKLTRLFASSKEGDFTKIGRFGIGFVSVFALEPDAVVVDTGRGGEKWRVLFRKDRTFARIALEEPVAGTRVRILKAVPPDVFAALRTRAREVLRFWCKHVDGEITFDGDVISGPLALDDALVTVRHQEEGTEILVGIVQGNQTFAGFYNKGLTLYEGAESALPGVAFKVSSRYLEHTLTRDNVLHDDQFERAMALVRRLAEGPLYEALCTQAEADDPGAWRALAAHVAGRTLPARFEERSLLPAEGGRLSLKAMRRAAAKAPPYRHPTSDALSRACHRAGVTVLLGTSEPGDELVEALTGTAPLTLARHYLLPEPPTAAEASAFQAVLPRLATLVGGKLAGLALGHVPGLPDQVAVAVGRLDEPTPVAEAGQLTAGFLARKRTLVLNLSHRAVQALQPVAAAEPVLAAWLLARLFALGRGELDAAREAALLTPTLAARRAEVAP